MACHAENLAVIVRMISHVTGPQGYRPEHCGVRNMLNCVRRTDSSLL
jgi:hypothetical protein